MGRVRPIRVGCREKTTRAQIETEEKDEAVVNSNDAAPLSSPADVGTS